MSIVIVHSREFIDICFQMKSTSLISFENSMPKLLLCKIYEIKKIRGATYTFLSLEKRVIIEFAQPHYSFNKRLVFHFFFTKIS